MQDKPGYLGLVQIQAGATECPDDYCNCPGTDICLKLKASHAL